MKRILVLGNPGSGKSTMAIKLGAILHLPVVHLDKLFWQPGWTEMNKEQWRNMQGKLVEKDSWIIDGNYDNTLEFRLPYADTVLYHDYSTALSLWRITKRILTNYGRTRPDMADNCPEKLDLSFIKFTWQFNARRKPAIEEKIREYFRGDAFIVFKRPADVRRFLGEMTNEHHREASGNS